ncbi:MAG: DUF3181 family protein [Cyanobacteriota bacterium]|nr:DUF3181 family protein [Cyanobacteriota bacterium]
MAESYTTEQIEALAAEIGENIYIDVAKWHLYLAEAHLHTVIAEAVAPLLGENSFSERAVSERLLAISVPLGGGKVQLPLPELIPKSGMTDLMEILKKFRDEY